MPARIIETNDSPLQPIDVDGITVDLIEMLENAREEMDACKQDCFGTDQRTGRLFSNDCQ